MPHIEPYTVITFTTLLRFTHGTILKPNKVNLHWDIRLKISGHAGQHDETATYFEGYRPAQMLADVISKVTFHQDLELDHFKDNKWVAK